MTSLLLSSLVSSLTSFTNKYEAIGKVIITKIEIDTHIFRHSINVNKNTIKTGRINSANDKPNQQVLKALPLFFSKKREIVVVAVWLDKPWPDNRIKKIPINKKISDEILENMKQEIDRNKITNNANFNIFTSSIFFPIQTKIILLNKVAEA